VVVTDVGDDSPHLPTNPITPSATSMVGVTHGAFTGYFEHIIYNEVKNMGLLSKILLLGDARFQGRECSKEPDACFRPKLIRPYKNDWPTLVVECGVSQLLKELRKKAAWWLDNSNQEVTIVILIKVYSRKIRIEEWQWGPITPRVTRNTPDPPDVGPKRTQWLNVNHGAQIVATGPLTIDFRKLFLRDPEDAEADILIGEEALQALASHIWSGIHERD